MAIDRSTVALALRLGTGQTILWGSTYYLPAILAAPIAATCGVEPWHVHLAFSGALVVSAAAGPAAGAWIDRAGGGPALVAASGLAALGLALLAGADGPLRLTAAWAVLGLAMGCGLYDAAFAAAVRLRGPEARAVITGITLVAGFASTVAWPLTAWWSALWGWSGACWAWIAVHLLVAVPLHLGLPAPGPKTVLEPDGDPAAAAPPPPRAAAALLATVFAATWFITTAMAAHLPALLAAGGVAPALAVACAALVGPSQVAARIGEAALLRRCHPLTAARWAAWGHPAGALAFAAAGWPAAFAILHGAGNGIMTIAKGTLPLVVFGPAGYGSRQGWLMVPARLAQAAAPVAFAAALAAWGLGALWLTAASAALSLAALAVLARRCRVDRRD
jgi:hypothetical protein